MTPPTDEPRPPRQSHRDLPSQLAAEAPVILGEWTENPNWRALTAAAEAHLRTAPTLFGAMLIDRLSPDDAPALISEAARMLALEAAAFVLAGDDLPGMLPVPAPVRDAVHALTAQVALLRAVTDRSGVRLNHRTPVRALPYTSACLTADAYTAAWGEPPRRFWLSAPVAAARRRHLTDLYGHLAITTSEDGSVRHTITYPTP
ncbi:hypothetical protein VSR01_28355 [Actinacidiphila sp. DG2A-62]|uniref:hypothetical protein n=1 Tax=Actinacidiphila sp. DG2A-62 TaxID=3108821 RepID=UPI002DBCA59B|nr:hypothetical protein [Actinacidiphila sp. DG2A-62]MEC3997203.1 hypothetical protein [Actinacidiphila sp. DG2A-62]